MIRTDIARAYRAALMDGDGVFAQALDDASHPLNEQAQAVNHGLNWFAYLHPQRDDGPIPMAELSGAAAAAAKDALKALYPGRAELDHLHGAPLPWHQALTPEDQRDTAKVRQNYLERVDPTYSTALHEENHPAREAVMSHRDSWYDWMYGRDGAGQPGPAPQWDGLRLNNTSSGKLNDGADQTHATVRDNQKDRNILLVRGPGASMRPAPQLRQAPIGIPDPNGRQLPTADGAENNHNNIRPGTWRDRNQDHDVTPPSPPGLRPLTLPEPYKGWTPSPLDDSKIQSGFAIVPSLYESIFRPLEMINKWGGKGSPTTQLGTETLVDQCKDVLKTQYPDIELIKERFEKYVPPFDPTGVKIQGTRGSSRADHWMHLQRADGSAVMIFLNTDSTNSSGDQTFDQLRRFKLLEHNAKYFKTNLPILVDWVAKLDFSKYTMAEYKKRSATSARK